MKTNALKTWEPFNFGEMPIFSTWFNDLVPQSSKFFTNSPKVNIKETDKAYEIEIANPGFSKEDTEIKIEDNVLYVSMNLETETKDEDEQKYHVKQWKKSSYSESWNIPENVIEENITAKYVDGVLTITLPKKQETSQLEDKSRIVTIE